MKECRLCKTKVKDKTLSECEYCGCVLEEEFA
jgi:hypothetical protein